MKRIHVNLKVEDLQRSLEFYSRLFGVAPTVRKPDYAKWMLEDPRVNFAIGVGVGRPGVEHLGIEAETREELEELRGGVRESGGPIDDEGETVCCYARSDKTWVVDGQGVSWEMFYTHGSAEEYHGEPRKPSTAAACCSPPEKERAS